jgi:hypothetical protein
MKPPLERNPTRNSKWLSEYLKGELKLYMKMFLNAHMLSMLVEV